MSETDQALHLLFKAIARHAPWYGGAAAAVVLLVRLYRSQPVQSLIPLALRWPRLPMAARLAFVGCLGGATSAVTAVFAGHDKSTLAASALYTAITAIAGHKMTRAMGHAQTQRALRATGGKYRPGSIRTALASIFPIDKRSVQYESDLERAAQTARRRENNNHG